MSGFFTAPTFLLMAVAQADTANSNADTGVRANLQSTWDALISNLSTPEIVGLSSIGLVGAAYIVKKSYSAYAGESDAYNSHLDEMRKSKPKDD
jgi:hypothetical protein